MAPRLEAIDFESLAGWTDDDHPAAFRAFERSAQPIAAGQNSPRPAQSVAPELLATARAALCGVSSAEARQFFEARFRPFRVVPENGQGFLTGSEVFDLAGEFVVALFAGRILRMGERPGQ